MTTKQVTKPIVDLTVLPSASVYLTVTIGSAMIGSSLVQFEDSPTPIAKGAISHIFLGTQSSLIGKKLKIYTNVLDSNIATQTVVVTQGFLGTTSGPVVINDSVSNYGDILQLTTEYKFS